MLIYKMNSNTKSDRLIWQHPYVNIFKQFKIENWKKSTKEGDVSSTLDKHIKTTVYKIQGSVPAGNYIQFPQATTQSLGLTGRYLYILFKPIPTKYFVVHIDTITDDGLVVRISFSNLFKEFKSTATWLQFPFSCQPAKGSIEHFASLGARQDFVGPAPLAQKWTMLVLDLQYILSVYINRKYCFMKNIRLCANMLVKNCFTSDICYDPRLSIRQARIVGIKSVDENFAPMPREMNFFLPKDKEWDDLYDVVRFPLDKPQGANLPFDSIQRVDDSPNYPYLSQESKIKKTLNIKASVGIIKSPRRDQSKVVDVSKHHKIFSSTNNMNVTTKPPEKALKKKTKVVTELPPVSLSLMETSNASCSDPEAVVVEDSSGDVHVFAGENSPEREIIVHRHFSRKLSGRSRVATTDVRSRRTTFTDKTKISNLSQSIDNLKVKSHQGTTSSIEPSPILKLDRLIGFGRNCKNQMHSYQSISLWHPTSSCVGSNDIVFYAAHAIVVALDTVNFRQQFFIGHTDAVVCIAFNSTPGNSPCIMASAQRGKDPVVRIWRLETQKCASIIRCQRVREMKALAFSSTGGVLAGIGRDTHGKTLFIVWNTSSSLRNGDVSVIAKATSDAEVSRIYICPTDDTRMVSCGRDNIRFWRVRSNQLRSCPVVLPSEEKLEEITDVKFAPIGCISSKNRPEKDASEGYSIFACTKGGYIIEIDFQKVLIRNLHRLHPLKSSNDKKKGIALNCLYFASSYLSTGSDDGMLRLWPLDLSAVFLEVEHEGPITEIDITKDDVKVLVATNVGTLGFLDISSRKYSTLMRSHVDVIRDSSIDCLRRTMLTCSDDKTIRVWDIDTMKQLYDFATPDDPPLVICSHPLLEIFACGFESGAVRIFHVSTTSILVEHSPSTVKITCVLFTLSGERFIAADNRGSLFLYDTSDVEHSGASLLRTLSKAIAVVDDLGPDLIVANADDRNVAFIGPNEFTVTVSSSSTLDELLRVDVSTGYKMPTDILSQRPKVDSPRCLAFSGSKLHHLLILTNACRLLKLESKTGKLLTVTPDMHRSKPSALNVCDNNNYLLTAGDKIVKVWDYGMSKDINFQAFIGHSSRIHNIFVTPDLLKVITVGEDAIFMWNLLCDSSHTSHEPKGIVVIGKGDDRLSKSDANQNLKDCPLPNNPPTPHKGSKNYSTSWIPPETLHTSDLDASHISEFTVDAKMMEKLSQPKEEDLVEFREVSINEEKLNEKMKKLKVSSLNEEYRKTCHSDASDQIPIKVAWNSKPKIDVTKIASPPESPPVMLPLPNKPSVLCHYISCISPNQPPLRTYAAPPGKEGLNLNSVIGYNGNGRGNLTWNPDFGLLFYSCGSILILERLNEGQKYNMLGHSEEISCIAMQHNGKVVASASASNGIIQSKICLWETSSLACLAVLKHHDYDIVDLSYSPDDRFLISLGDFRESTVVIWSAINGEVSPVVVTSTKTCSPVHKIFWNPLNSYEFVTVGSDATLSFWLLDAEQQKVTLNLHNPEVPDEVKYNEYNRRLVDFTSACFADDDMLYVGSSAGVVSAWDTTTNTCVLHWKADTAEIIVMKARGDRLLVSGASRSVRLWSLMGASQGRCWDDIVSNFVMDDELCFDAPIISGAFDDTLDMGIVGTTAGALWYLNWTNRTTVRMVSGHSGKITDIAFDHNGRYFATSTDRGSVRIWDASTYELTVQFQVIDFGCDCITYSHPCNSAHSSNQSQAKLLAAGYEDGTIRIFNLNKVQLKLKCQPHSKSVTSLQFAWDNNTLLSGSQDGLIAATSMATGVTSRFIKDHRGAVISSIACSLRLDHPASLTLRKDDSSEPDRPSLALVCASNRRASVWDTDWKCDVCNRIDWITFPSPCFTPDGKKISKKNSVLPPSVCLFHPTDPNLLIYCGFGMDKSVQLYSLVQRKVIKSTSIPNWASSLDVSPDGRMYAIGTNTRLVELIDAKHETFQDFLGHSAEISNVRYSPDGKYLFTTANSELFVWEVKT